MFVLTIINKIKFFGERWEEAVMRKLAILTGVAVLGLGLGAGDASARSSSLLKLSDVCGLPLTENTDVKDPAADYISSNCVITVPAPFNIASFHVPVDFRSSPNNGPTPAVSGIAGYDPVCMKTASECGKPLQTH